MKNNLNCPVSPNKADENVTRIAAFVMTAFFITGIILQSYILVFLIAIDFTIRAFSSGKYSIIRAVSKTIAGLLKLKSKPIDAAPKKFAAGLGMFMSALTGILLYTGDFTAVYLIGAVLIVCALLEAVFALCLGCHVYSFIIIPLTKFQNTKSQQLL